MTNSEHNSSDIKHLSCVQKAVSVFHEKLDMQLIMSVVNLDLKSNLAYE